LPGGRAKNPHKIAQLGGDGARIGRDLTLLENGRAECEGDAEQEDGRTDDNRARDPRRPF
jgi:hypothetical protein